VVIAVPRSLEENIELKSSNDIYKLPELLINLFPEKSLKLLKVFSANMVNDCGL
jgi:hypothetical protein